VTARQARRGVLVIQPLPGIGDMVWHIPHLRAIARHEPEGQVSVLTKPRSLSDQLLASLPEVAEVLWVKRKPGPHDGLRGFFRLVSDLRRKRFRKVWILHDSSRYALAAWLAGIPRRTGIASGWQRMLFTDHPEPAVPQAPHTVERADLLLSGLAVETRRAVPLITPSAASRSAVLARFAACPRPWFALGIGSSEAFKQWGAENFSALARALQRRYGGSCFLLGGASEQAMATAIVQEGGDGAARIPLIQAPLQEVMALLADAQLFVGNDTGMLNLSAACGAHSIGLFGHTVSAWVARSSPRIHPVYPDAGLSSEGVSQIHLPAVLQAINQLESVCGLEAPR